ncbi:MAG: nucleotide sugar dehydrogenase [Rhodospirillaceae bacterium]|nr:nucleotide sugar dehydrogenase [Rhodospirillaceae bacterium]
MPQKNETPTRVCVIGLGYVGLPLAVALARAGHDLLGFDTDPHRIRELRDGNDRTGEVDMDAADASSLALTGDESALADRDIYIVTVPTPVDGENRPDLEAVLAASASVGRALAKSKARASLPIVAFESTVYPGVTEDICGPAIEAASGKKRSRDFLLGYSPERINPGDRTHGLAQIVKVVAGENEDATRRLERLYGSVTKAGVFVARNIRTAEAAKVIENAQRDVNIAFVNEIAMIFAKLGLSVDDVLEAARTKWNFLDFRPGLVGGHCISVDPYYLAFCAAQLGHEAEIILAGRRINDDMGAWISDRIADAYEGGGGGTGDAAGRSESAANVRPPRTLVLGLAFKENVPDIRNTRVELLVTRLATRGHQVEVHDALADATEAKNFYGIELCDALDATGDAGGGAPFDCLVAAVAHNEYRALADEDFVRLVRPGGLIADVKGIWRDRALPGNVRRWQL